MQGKTSCPDGCGLELKSEFINLVLDIEKEIGQELVFTSGARCAAYNKTVGGLPGDAHEQGLAGDIVITDDAAGRSLLELFLEACFRHGVNRFGNGQANHNYFHFDIAANLPQHKMWCYK